MSKPSSPSVRPCSGNISLPLESSRHRARSSSGNVSLPLETPRSRPRSHSQNISPPLDRYQSRERSPLRNVIFPDEPSRPSSRLSCRNISLPTELSRPMSRISSRNISLPFEISSTTPRPRSISRPVSESLDTAWQGNLPCVVGPKSGCTRHNPDHLTIFFDPKLVAMPTTHIIKSLLFRIKDSPEDTRVARAEEIWPDVKPDDSAACEPLPAIHSSAHYNLAYYHLNSIKKQVASLSSLRCQGKAGSYPCITYDISPKIIRGTFILRYDYSFTQKWKNPPGPGKIYAHEATPLLFDGFNFAVCPHMSQRFTSTTWHYQRNTHTVAINYKLKNALKQNIPGTWNNLVNQQPVLMSCCYCFTEFRVTFQLKQEEDKAPEVEVLVRVYKDLGGGTYLSDPKWTSAFKGCNSMIRETSDFGRIEKWFEKKETRSSV